MDSNPQQQKGKSQTHKEVKLADGIYFTDFRKDADDPTQHQLSGLGVDNMPNNPELLKNIFDETQMRINQLEKTIKIIKEMDNYLEDYDFVDTLKEDYPLIVKNLKEQIRLLDHLDKIDPGNKFYEEHPIKDIQAKIELATKENDEFQAFQKKWLEDQIKKAYGTNDDQKKEGEKKEDEQTEPEKQDNQEKKEEIFI